MNEFTNEPWMSECRNEPMMNEFTNKPWMSECRNEPYI